MADSNFGSTDLLHPFVVRFKDEASLENLNIVTSNAKKAAFATLLATI